MAINKRGNLIYCDAAGSDFTSVRKVFMIITTTIGNAGTFTFKDKATGGNTPILSLEESATNKTAVYDFTSKPLVFTSGLEVDALPTSAVVTLVIGE